MAAQYLVHPGPLQDGRIVVPGDKSISHRAAMLGAIAQGETRLRGFLEGADCLATLAAFQAMGVSWRREGDEIVIDGVGVSGLRAPAQALDVGNSGTSMRLLAGLLAGQRFASTLTGDASLRRRPMERVISPLRQMGAGIHGAVGDTAPLGIEPGALRGIYYAMPVASAQVKSCLLLAGLYARGRTTVTEPAPCRDHTECMLEAFGVELERGHGQVALQGGQTLTGRALTIPADLSSAAFFLVGAAITPGAELLIEGVGVNPTRTGVITILCQMGAHIEMENPREFGNEPVADLRVQGARLEGVEIDPALVPLAIDEFPALFVAAACAHGRTRLRGGAELRVKESDRIAVMAAGLTALGVAVSVYDDGICISGGPLRGGGVDSQGDHRIAMAFAVAATRASGAVTIRDTSNVATSFPGFVATARSVGMQLEQMDD
ncbi:MAG: 3-phosphoshikimate 1-carboxyvinyltransferase [Salinisphaera sp.]|nr:3-phosphoshikimate 1-carboxyvinyltransferase [Salinisphaera sp.]